MLPSPLSTGISSSSPRIHLSLYIKTLIEYQLSTDHLIIKLFNWIVGRNELNHAKGTGTHSPTHTHTHNH